MSWRRRVQRTKVVIVATLVGTVGAAVGAVAHPGHPPVDSCADGRVVTRDGWTSIAAPSFPDSSSRRVAAYAVDPRSPAHLIVTNGTTVLASADGGCHWTATFQVPTVPSLAGAVQVGPQSKFTIQSLRFPGPIAYLSLVGTDGSGETTSRIVVSEDSGATWRDGSGGLPPTGAVRWVEAAPGTPTTAYAMVTDAGLYATADGGLSWAPRQAATDQTPPVDHLTVDPLDPRDLWAWRDGDLLHSRDGGVTYVKSVGSSTTSDVLTVAVTHLPGSEARLLVVYLGDRAARSDDGGEHFRPIPIPPGAKTLAAHRTQPDRAVVTTEDRVYGSTSGGDSWEEITPSLADRFASAQATAISAPMLFVRSENGLERTTLDGPLVRRDRTRRVSPLLLTPPQPARLEPPGGELRVEPGTEVTLTRELSVPFRRGPLDVFFLVDSTNSMAPLLENLEAGITSIASALRGAGIDARFGLGELKDYPLPPYGRRSDFPYRRVRDLGAPDASLRAALAELEEGGGEDTPESQLAALFQVATGAGQPGFIAANQHASFRPEARRIVILGTDAPFHRSDGDATYPGPRFATAVEALRQRGIAVVGISLDERARPDLQQVGIATGAVASIDIDCTGDGIRDLNAGQPLVCPLSEDGSNLAAAVVAALNAVEDIGEIAINASAPEGVVRRFGPASSGPVNLRANHVIPFSTTYGCREDQAGRRFPVSLTVTAKGAAVLAATDTVVCAVTPVSGAVAAGAAPAARPTPPPEPSPPPAPAPPAPSPPAPAVQPPIAQLQPQPQPQPQLQPQLSPQVQSGMALQEQERLQLALSGTGDAAADGGDVDDVLAFRDRRAERAPSLPLAAAALAMTSAAAVATRRRTERAAARAPTRIDRRNP